MSNEIETAIYKLIEAIRAHNTIRAIGMSGGERPFPQPGEGDIDLFVYCTKIPSQAQRQKLLLSYPESTGKVEFSKIAGGHWGEGDCLEIAGVETWLLYFTLDEARSELEAILAGQFLGRQDSYYYPIGRCAMWKTMRALYDPDGFLQSFKLQLAEYPQELASAIVAYHLQALADVEDLERAVQRKDLFFFHFALDLALDHFLQAIFALNQEYFPSRKRSEIHLQNFKYKPPACEQRLRQVIACGGDAATLEEAHQIWTGLVRDLELSAKIQPQSRISAE